MRLYIAGPMTGHPQFNYPAFMAMAELLRSEGHDVVSPAELDDPEIVAISMASPDGNIATINSHGQTWGDFLARDVKLIADTPGLDIIVLPGWAASRGARLETFVAHLCGRVIYRRFLDRLERVAPDELIIAWVNNDFWIDELTR